LGGQHATAEQCRDNAAGLPVAGSDDASGVGARQFPAVENGFKDAARLERQMVEPDFLLRPQEDSRAQTVWLDQAFHESNLIDAGCEEEPCESHQRFFA